jgi:hypothetical protein
MPIPNTYRKIAGWLKPRKAVLWFTALFGLILLVTPFVILAVSELKSFPKVPAAIGLLVLVFSWGLICIESWFSDKPGGFISRKLQYRFPRIYTSGKAVLDWYACVFLLFWFFTGIKIALVLLTKF